MASHRLVEGVDQGMSFEGVVPAVPVTTEMRGGVSVHTSEFGTSGMACGRLGLEPVPQRLGLEAVGGVGLSVYADLGLGAVLKGCHIEGAEEAQASFNAMEDELRVLIDARGQPLIRDDEELQRLDADTRVAVIRDEDGNERNLELTGVLEDGNERNLELTGVLDDLSGAQTQMFRQHFAVWLAYMDRVLPPCAHTPRPKYVAGNRGNVEESARPAFGSFDSFKLPQTPEDAVTRHLSDIGHNVKDSDERGRQQHAALKVAGASMAYVDTLSHGLGLEINQANNRLVQVNQALRAGRGRRGALLAQRREIKEEMTQLQQMRERLSAMSYTSLMSAERAYPTQSIDQEGYDRAASEAMAISRRMIPGRTSSADAFAADSAMLLAAQSHDDIQAERRAGEPLPEPFFPRLAIDRCYRRLGQNPANVEGPTLRFYDIYRAHRSNSNLNAQDLAEGRTLFHPQEYSGVLHELQDRLQQYEKEAEAAMIDASQGYEEKSGAVAKGVTTWRHKGVAANLRKKLVDGIVTERRAAVERAYQDGVRPAAAAARRPPPHSAAPPHSGAPRPTLRGRPPDSDWDGGLDGGEYRDFSEWDSFEEESLPELDPSVAAPGDRPPPPPRRSGPPSFEGLPSPEEFGERLRRGGRV